MHATAINRSSKRSTQDNEALWGAIGLDCQVMAMGEVRELSPQADLRP